MKFCERPFDFIHMDPDGPIRVCGWTDESIGDLSKDDLATIWHGEKAELIRESIRDGSFRYCRCISCPFLEGNALPDLDKNEFEKRCTPSEMPLKFSIACDKTCNHSCPSCRDKMFAWEEGYKERLELILDRVLPYVNKANEIHTNGCGDLFSSSVMMNFLQKVKPENPNCTILLETNGALFDADHWEKIKHFGDYYLIVTVTPNSYEKRTFKYLNGGHDDYERLIDNLYFIRGLKREGKVDKYLISIVVQDRNYAELPDFAKRSIEDFEADQVIVKPLYKWFGLSEELYWYKDVLNPLHPYHSEFLDIMKDPYLSNEKIYFWNGGKTMHKPALHPAYRERDHLELVAKLMGDENLGDRLKHSLEEKGVNSLFIYGDIAFTEILGRILIDAGMEISGFVARDKTHDSILGIPVTCLCDFSPGPDSAVIISNYHFYNNIKRDFDFYRISTELIPADKLM